MQLITGQAQLKGPWHDTSLGGRLAVGLTRPSERASLQGQEAKEHVVDGRHVMHTLETATIQDVLLPSEVFRGAVVHKGSCPRTQLDLSISEHSTPKNDTTPP